MTIHIDRTAVRAFVALLLLSALSSAAVAGEVYKCKGSTGETIYQNLPCPTGAKPMAHSSYDPVPDDPSQLRAAVTDANQRREQEIIQTHEAAAAPRGGAVASADGGGEAAAFQCSVNGRSWVQAKPCPATSIHQTPVFVSGTTVGGTPVSGTGMIIDTVPVGQQGMSKDQLCTKLQANPKTSEGGSSTYERNKLRSANGC